MAAKRRAAPPPPPPPESEPSASGSDESSEDEATESPPPLPSQTKSPAKRAEVSASKPQLKPRAEESSDSSSEGEDSEDEATPAAKPAKELAPDESAESGSESDHEAAAKASREAAGAAARKRGATGSAETADAKPAKRARASNFVPGKSKEDDEIAILRGLSDYAGKGSDQSIDATALYEFVKGSLNHHEDPQQVADTVRRLKRRYQTIQSNAKRGKSAVPNEGNKKTIHDLSKMIWSQRNAVRIEDSAVASPERKKSKKRQMSSRKVLEFQRDGETERPEQKSTEHLVNGHPRKNFLFSCWKELENDNTVGLKLLKEGLELMEPSLARTLEERWKKIEIAKLETLQKQRDLLQEQMEMVVDVLKQQRK